jgi:capsule biosynthesis phosphatase
MTKKIVMDLDETISVKLDGKGYECASPQFDVISRMREYRSLGFQICIFTARNMRTYEGNIGMINLHTLPVIIDWLSKYDVPYDEILVGKPWCGHNGFYVDDRAVRPDEFVTLSPSEIKALLSNE